MEGDAIVISLLLSIFGLLLGILANSLININTKLNEISYIINSNGAESNKLNEIKDIIMELKGMVNILASYRGKQDPP